MGIGVSNQDSELGAYVISKMISDILYNNKKLKIYFKKVIKHFKKEKMNIEECKRQ